MTFKKTQPNLSLEDFFVRAKKVKEFTSSSGKRYSVQGVDRFTMHFIRIDADINHKWSFDLRDVYKAYIELEDYKTALFRKYVPLMHSPARGLLLYLGLLI